MTDQTYRELDAALDELATDVRENTPRPGPDLIARVLADAGEIAAANRRTAPSRAGRTPARRRIAAMLLGWQCGALAAMAVALILGIGIGTEMDSADLPMMQVEEDGDFFTADSGFLPEDLL